MVGITPLETWIEPSGKLVLREKECRSVTAQRSLCPLSEVHSVFCNSVLPKITLPSNSKQAYHVHHGAFVTKSMALDGSIVSPKNKISFKIYMYTYTLIYVSILGR